MTTILIADTETTGTEPSKDRVVEVAAILFSLEHFSIVSAFSSLIHCEGQPAESEQINHIPSALLPSAPAAAEVWKQIRTYVEVSKAIVAHNAEFDHGFFPSDIRDLRPWICTQDDIEWPRRSGSKALIAVALAHGLGVSYAHRAMTDCDLIARLLERCHEMGHDVRSMLRRGLRPKAKFQAIVSYDQKEIAKAHGFGWKGKPDGWVRRMAIEDTAKLPFPVRRLGSDKAAGDGPIFSDPLATWNGAAA